METRASLLHRLADVLADNVALRVEAAAAKAVLADLDVTMRDTLTEAGARDGEGVTSFIRRLTAERDNALDRAVPDDLPPVTDIHLTREGHAASYDGRRLARTEADARGFIAFGLAALALLRTDGAAQLRTDWDHAHKVSIESGVSVEEVQRLLAYQARKAATQASASTTQ